MDPLTIAAIALALATASDAYKVTPKGSRMHELISFLSSMVAIMPPNIHRPTSGYLNIHDYVLERGKAYPPQQLTAEELAYIKDTMDSLRWDFEIKQCFSNAQWLAINDFSGKLRYVEGFAVGTTIPVYHGWVTINDKPIELTWRVYDPDGRTEPYIQPGSDFAYIGIEYDTDFIRNRVFEEGSLRCVIDDWESGWPELQKSRLRPYPSPS